MSKGTLLLVEDDPSVRLVLERMLLEIGWVVLAVETGAAAMAQLRSLHFDLMIVDLGLPDRSGIEVLEAARAQDEDMELVVVTGSLAIEPAISALRLRVADYLIKPIRLAELQNVTEAARLRRVSRRDLVGRLRALLRLGEPAPLAYQPQPALPSALQIDERRRQVIVDGRTVRLSGGDLRLLLCLAGSGGAVLTVEEIAREVLDFPCSPHEARDLIKARVHKLRQKLELDPSAPRYLLSVRGVGYTLAIG